MRAFLAMFLLFLTACSSQQSIVSDLPEGEANEILVYLASKGIPALKLKGSSEGGGGTAVTYEISVPEEQSLEAMAVLNSAGLPRPKGTSLLDIFQGGGMMQNDTERAIRYQAGLAEQLAGMIRRFDGILEAAVVLSIPTADQLNANPAQKTTASVYIKHQGVLDDPNNQLSNKIRRLLSGSVSNLSVDDVIVVSDRSKYADVTLPPSIEPIMATAEWRSVLGIIVEESSVGGFQLLLGTLLVIILLLLVAVGWLVWKLTRQIHVFGLTSLFTTVPYEAHPTEISEEAPPNEGMKR